MAGHGWARLFAAGALALVACKGGGSATSDPSANSAGAPQGSATSAGSSSNGALAANGADTANGAAVPLASGALPPGGDSGGASATAAAARGNPSATGTSAPTASPTGSAAASSTAALPSPTAAATPLGSIDPGRPPGPPTRPVIVHTSGDHWAVDASAPGDCQASSDCVATLHVTATSGFHVNRRFPHKFTATQNPSVAFPAGNRFTSFGYAGDNDGALPVRFQGTSPGASTLTGTLRTCVCIGDTACEPVDVPITLNVPMR